MRTCPNCGRQVPPHVATCPHDDTPLGPPKGRHSNPPTLSTSSGPGDASSSAGSTPDNSAIDWSTEPDATQGSTVRAWIGVLIASLVLLGGYGWARERMLGPTEQSDHQSTDQNADDSATAEGSKRANRSKRPKRRADRSGNDPAEYDEPVPTFEVDDREFGDLIAQGERERAAAAAGGQVRQEVEPFDPPPEMYQPDGAYSPTASYVEPGARDNVVTLNLGSGSSESGPLDEAEVKKVLRVSALMPCYDEVVQKVPQMRGRVKIRFVIAGDGHVMEATILQSDLRSRTVESCIIKRARGWRFPASGGQKTRFTTHFDFSSR